MVVLTKLGADVFDGDSSRQVINAEAQTWATEVENAINLIDGTTGIDASSVTYLNAGTGAVSQTLLARLSNEVYVTDFGAVGDDSTDNQAAFEAAIAHVSSLGGGTVKVPEGTFRVSDELTLPARVSIIGEGQDTAIRTTSATAAILVPSGNQFIQDLAFQTAITRTGTDGVIEMDGVGEIFIHRCRFNSHLHSINIKNACSLIWMSQNIIYKAGATSVGIEITGPTAVGNDYFLRDNLIKSLDPAVQGSYGIYIDRSGGTYLSGNSVLQSGTPLKLKAASGTELTWTFSSNDVFDTSVSVGVDIESESGGVIKGVTFTSLWSASNGQEGVKIHGAGTIDGIDFTDPQIKNNSFHGINVDSGINVFVNGGVVTGNSGAGSGTYHGVNFGAGAEKFSVIGTFAGAGHGFGASQGYGVVVQSGSSDNYIISHIKGWGNVTGSVLDLGGTGTNKIVANNV